MERKAVKNSEVMYIYGICTSKDLSIGYIGKTKSLTTRLKCHIQEAKLGKMFSIKNNWLKSHLNKECNAYIVLIEICSGKNVDEREIYWIDHFNKFSKLKNMTAGGTGGTTHLGRPTKVKRDDGTIYNSVKEAGEANNCDRNSIHACLSKTVITAGGRQWFRPDEEIVMRVRSTHVVDKTLLKIKGTTVYCSNGEKYVSINDAGRQLNIPAANIAQCIKRIRVQAHGLKFWTDGTEPRDTKPFPTKPLKCLNNGEIYKSARIAAKELNICWKAISANLNGKQSHVKGYKFEFNIIP